MKILLRVSCSWNALFKDMTASSFALVPVEWLWQWRGQVQLSRVLGMQMFTRDGPALSEKAHTVSCGQVTTSVQITAGHFLQSSGRCSVSVTHHAGIGACKWYKDPAKTCLRPVGRWETLCSRKSRERKRGETWSPWAVQTFPQATWSTRAASWPALD